MDKLKKIIEQHGRWSSLSEYTDRIEAYISTDFSHALENAKALLETIGKEICSTKGVSLGVTPTINAVLKNAFVALGYSNNDMVNRISGALATIGQQVGNLRNEIGATSHGKLLAELKERNNKVDELTREFLIDSTIIVASFLIRTFENENPWGGIPETAKISYFDNDLFNEYWDESFGDFVMGDYSYTASEIFFNVDYKAYVSETTTFLIEGKNES